jgi:hypothetical protein
MWIYEIATGVLRRDGRVFARGLYSGDPEHKNDPTATRLKSQGPLPPGAYRIGSAVDTAEHGPLFVPLIPVDGTELFGRGGFGFHGDSKTHPGAASNGCVIGPHDVREVVAKDIGHLFIVLPPLEA